MKFILIAGALASSIVEPFIQEITAFKEAMTVKSSFAGCCGKTWLRCETCHIDIRDKLMVGNYHYHGYAIMSYHLGSLRKSSTCN
ncbi:hypothetical protein L0F63_002421 [Massospora cicadina]|nr:hypothetical protein L0F63_002421 [Massospora cicadina]